MKTGVVSIAMRQQDGADPAPDPTPGYILEHQVGHLLRRAHQRHTSIFQEGIGDSQLTPTQFAAVMKIKDLGQVSQNQLGRLTAMDPATIQGVIQRLLVRGLVERYPDASDRRCTLLRLSPAGKQLATSVIGPARAISEQTLSPLGESERATFLDLLRKLI